MKRAGAVDAKAIDELAGLIYEGPLEAIPWQQALEQLRRRLGANHVTLLLQATTPHSQGLAINAGELATEAVGAYHGQYYALDPFVGLPSDHVVTVSEFLDESSWLASDYYQRFLRGMDVFHILGADIHLADGGGCRLRVSRPRRAPQFSAADKALCDRLLPHFRRALRVHVHISRLEAERSLYSETLSRMEVATIFLDDTGKLLRSNAIAARMLQAGDGIGERHGQLRANLPSEQQRLQHLIAAALSPQAPPGPRLVEAMSITRSGGGHLSLMVQRMARGSALEGERRAALVIFLRDHEQVQRAPEEIVRQVFRFTPAETALAMQLLNGLSLEQAADALHVTRNTARTHLSRIFAKLGVRRQTEMMRVLLGSVVSLGAAEVHDADA